MNSLFHVVNVQMIMMYDSSSRQIVVVLPLHVDKAEIVFSRPNRRLDNFSVRIPPSPDARHLVSTAALGKGYWHAELIWSQGRSRYYSEKLIEIH